MITIMFEAFIEKLLRIAGPPRRLAGDRVLFRANDPVSSIYIVVEGQVRLTRALPHGAPLTLQRAGPGQILAEASLFSSRYHCDAVATEKAVLRPLAVRQFRAALREDLSLAFDLIRYLAQEVQRRRAQAETLSLKTVAERVNAWLDLNGGELPVRGRQRQMAAEIGVTPEALYRELGKRRRRSA